MRDSGPSDKNVSPKDARSRVGRPKPDVIRARLTAQELHAYYIALISSAALSAAPDGLHLKPPCRSR
jgi:hypothetical protein